MYGLEKDTIGGFNSMLEKQKAQEGDCRVTTVLFDHEYQLLHDRIDLQAVRKMSSKDYTVGGSTALLDAIGKTIAKLAAVQENTAEEYKAQNVMFVIITDGAENASREYTARQIKKMIQKMQKEQDWQFIFLGANIDAVQTASHFGIQADHAADYIADEAGTSLNFQTMSDTVSCFRSTGNMPKGCLGAIREDQQKRSRKGTKKAR